MYIVKTYKGEWISVRSQGLLDVLKKYYVTNVIWLSDKSYIETNKERRKTYE